jgi:AmmeMemoRadiSam system protein B
MIDASFRPALRSVETIVVPDAKHGRVLVLRDTQGVTDAHAAIPPALVPIVARFTGQWSCEQIARDATRELGVDVDVDVIIKLAEHLDRGLFLESPSFRAARARIEREFADARVRPASHAGGAYHAEPGELARYLNDECLARAKRPGNGGTRRDAKGRLVALVAPHIDPWRGAVGYGHAYGAVARAVGPDVDTFILFGTSHAPMREAFALCKKAFATPLGDVEADTEAIDTIAASAAFDPYRDQFNHKREHSLEFQVVFLKHVLGDRPFRIIPILAGLGEHQARGTDPAKDDRATRFLDAVRDLVESRPGRVAVVAGADMAHVGPRFGDETPLAADARQALEQSDRNSLAHATTLDASAFWTDVAKDLDTRRVCGLAPIYSLICTIGEARGELLHYEQTIDKQDGSIVSHAAIAYYA